MAENVSVSRWDLFIRWFLFFLFLPAGVIGLGTMVFEHTGATALLALVAFGGAFTAAVSPYWEKQYGSRYEWVKIVLQSIVFVILLVIVWYGIERHRHNALGNQAPYASSSTN
jgi:hypothetical protein